MPYAVSTQEDGLSPPMEEIKNFFLLQALISPEVTL